MLNWWLGRTAEGAPRDGGKFKQKTNCSNTDSTSPDDPEPPETPAPVFAARAFKSALFGTPAFQDEDEPETPLKGASAKFENTGEGIGTGGVSPIKPQGILLTPGTATTRRKTVSFGEEVVDNEDKSAIGKGDMPGDCPGKFPSPWTPRVDAKQKNARRTTLTRTLEAARDEKAKQSSSTKSTEEAVVPPKTSNGSKGESGVGKIGQTLPHPVDNFDGDMTLDLNEPHSQSGRYWKSEYEKYHEEAMAEMRKLVKYKQLAKSYAKKKDSEAIDLGEKLKEEQQKVANMEAKVAELVAQVASGRFGGKDNESPDLMKNLARQTALAMRYKDQVDQFQTALRERDAHLDRRNKVFSERRSSVSAAVTDSELNHEPTAANEQFAQMDLFQDEIRTLRLNLLAAERKVIKLQDENARLSKDFTTVSEALKKSDSRRQSIEVQSEERDKSLKCLQEDYDILKEKAKSQRREAETLLEKRYKQVVKLKAELASLKEEIEDLNHRDVNGVPSRKSSRSREQINQDKTKPAELNTDVVDAEDLISFRSPLQLSKRSNGDLAIVPRTQDACDAGIMRLTENSAKGQPNDNENVSPPRLDDVDLVDNDILAKDRFAWRSNPSDTDFPAKPGAETPRNSKQHKVHTALSEIINNAEVSASPVQAGNQLTPGFHERFSNLSLESPKLALPSLEPSYEHGQTRAAKSKRYATSPRPSMFNIPASPTKQTFNKTTPPGKDTETNRSNLGSSRLSSMSSRGRITLPPDRAAAAKARLQQKNAEKKRAQAVAGGDQKENIR